MDESITLPDGTHINDVLHLFQGDHPAQQHEAGQNKGGNYPCILCEGISF